MAKRGQQKLKMLCLQKILLEKTDEDHGLTVNEIIGHLALYGIDAERKSVYDDIELLCQYGMDIEKKKSRSTYYYVASRTFELPELKLLVDAVQCSRFITKKKSEGLIRKIVAMGSEHQAKQLQRQVYVADRVKTMNESIYYNVDRLHAAINGERQVSFRYFDYNIKKDKVFRKEGARYLVNPYALTWDDENYYLVAYSDAYRCYTHYRVDRMSGLEVEVTPRVALPEDEGFDLGAYAKKTFSMFGGREERVQLEFDKSLINAVIDRFGADIALERGRGDACVVSFTALVSAPFFGWLSMFGGQVRFAPASVAEEFVFRCGDHCPLWRAVSAESLKA